MSDALNRLRQSLFWSILRHRAWLVIAAFVPWLLPRSHGIGMWSGVFGIVLASLILAAEAWFWRRTVQRQFFSWLNRYCPELEDSSQFLESAETAISRLQQQRLRERWVQVDQAQLFTQVRTQRGRASLVWRAFLIVNLCFALLVTWASYSDISLHKSAQPSNSAGSAKSVTALADLTLEVETPAYTGLPHFTSTTKDIEVPEHSKVRWCLLAADAQQARRITGSRVALGIGDELSFSAEKESFPLRMCATWTASESVLWTWRSGEANAGTPAKAQRWTLKVKPDAAPEIIIEQPKEFVQVLTNSSKDFVMQIQVRDDYRVQSAQIHMTLARGSGENIRFSDREVVIPQGANPHQRGWSRRWTLQELGMEPGDELYFFVRTSDNAPTVPHTTNSPTYTIRLPSPEAKEEQTSVLPVLVKPESLRSQRQIILDTEALLADIKAKPQMNPAVVRQRSETIANDQAALRRRYGKFLGEESSLFGDEVHEEHDDHHGAGNGANKDANKDANKAAGGMAGMMQAYGHSHDQEENATLFDEATKKILRRVLAAMWDAEKSLRAITPANALPPENKALEGIKQLQQADRIYLHKAAFTPPVIKEEKRFSGDALEAKSWKLQQDKQNSPTPPEVEALMQALESDAALPGLWAKTARSWLRQGLANEDQSLLAQAAVQDVIDGCQACRSTLRAWLRQAAPQGTVVLQAPTLSTTTAKLPQAFERGWSKPASTADKGARK